MHCSSLGGNVDFPLCAYLKRLFPCEEQQFLLHSVQIWLVSNDRQTIDCPHGQGQGQ